MNYLEQWALICDAYRKTSFKNLIKNVYLAKSKGSLFLWIVSIILILWILNLKISFVHLPLWGDLLGLLIIIIFYGFIFEKTLKIGFKSFYEKQHYSKLIKMYSKNREFLRYLLFKENLLQTISCLNKIDFNQIQTIIEEEIKSNQGSIISKHPFITFLLGLITALMAGGASIKEGWQHGIIPIVLGIAISLLLFTIIVFEMFRPNEVKYRELKKFIFWLKSEYKSF
jgi:hypothetical protein